MSEAILFAGPSLPEIALPSGWKRLPPAGRGDVLRALLRERPRAIGLVDGWVYDRPSVSHKEILFAVGEGTVVIGAAGVGAIRAAELGAFGMRGVGEVYGAFSERFLDADAEVAVATTDGRTSVSVALVDVRATLQSAQDAAVVDEDLALRLLSAAKGIHFMERTFSAMADEAGRGGASATGLDAFARWLPHGFRSVKASDALRLLDALTTALSTERKAVSAEYPARPTETPAWAKLYERISSEVLQSSEGKHRSSI